MTKEAKQRLISEIRTDIQRWAAKIGVQPRSVRIQRMTRKWASCSTRGRICFSTELLAQPSGFREVVIVHELLHLMVPNHGKLFKSLMKAYVPDWDERVVGRVSGLCGTAAEQTTPLKESLFAERRYHNWNG